MPKPSREKAKSKLTVSEMLKRRVAMEKSEYPTYPTHIAGVNFRMEPGSVTKDQTLVQTFGSKVPIRALFNLANRYFRAQAIADQANEPVERLKKGIKARAAEVGFRGIESFATHQKMSVYPSYPTEYDTEVLESELRSLADNVITKRLGALVTLKPNHRVGPEGAEGKVLTRDMIRLAISGAVAGSMGCSLEEAESFIKFEEIDEVDESRLAEYVDSGQANLSPDVGVVYESWTLRTGDLKGLPE